MRPLQSKGRPHGLLWSYNASFEADASGAGRAARIRGSPAGGRSPLLAVRYQMRVVFMIAAGATTMTGRNFSTARRAARHARAGMSVGAFMQAEPLIAWPEPVFQFLEFVGAFLAIGPVGFRYF